MSKRKKSLKPKRKHGPARVFARAPLTTEDRETRASRIAIEAFTTTLITELGAHTLERDNQLRTLAGTEHQHTSLIALITTLEVMSVHVKIVFGDVIPRAAVQEMINKAKASPGSVPLA